MNTTDTHTRGIYSDAYMFDIASAMLDSGKDTIAIADHLMRVLGASESKALEIIALAWGP